MANEKNRIGTNKRLDEMVEIYRLFTGENLHGITYPSGKGRKCPPFHMVRTSIGSENDFIGIGTASLKPNLTYAEKK